MPEYLITWTIEIEASDAIEAVREARKIQLDPDSHATVFKAAAVDEEEEEIDISHYFETETEKLMKQFGGINGEHPDFPVQAWGENAIDDCTRLSYWDWVLLEIKEQEKRDD